MYAQKQICRYKQLLKTEMDISCLLISLFISNIYNTLKLRLITDKSFKRIGIPNLSAIKYFAIFPVTETKFSIKYFFFGTCTKFQVQALFFECKISITFFLLVWSICFCVLIISTVLSNSLVLILDQKRTIKT